jgi:tetratricopeptide (TPR) repeat protein
MANKAMKKSPPAAKAQVEIPYQTAIRHFEVGVRAFQKQDYAKAAEVFEKLVDIDAREVAERAQVHLRLCRQRTGRVGPGPKSADEYYALGVACLNTRDLIRAVENLAKADKLKPHQDHIQYALAVSHALRGNADEAFAHLEAAFALRPENRIHARRDEDFHGIATDPRFRRLVHPTAGH